MMMTMVLKSVVRPTILALSLMSAFARADTPINDLPNPYTTTAPWGEAPEGKGWGAFNGVAIDNDGESVWVVTRCGANPEAPVGGSPFVYDSCANTDFAPVMKLSAQGRVLKRFGGGLFIFPHKMYVDGEGNVWVVDARHANERELKKNPKESAKGHIVVKFSPDGRELLRLGTPGVAGNPPNALTEPCSVVVAPNGDIFVAEGHSGQNANSPPSTVARVSKFTREGKFIKSFGTLGSGPVQFRTPHDITMDDQGRLLVADRGNNRIQFLDQDGNYLQEWKQFSRPSGIALRNGKIYVADSESNGFPDADHPGWRRGIRVGSLTSGQVEYFIPDDQDLKPTSFAEGIAVDKKGVIYGGQVGQRQLVRHSGGGVR